MTKNKAIAIAITSTGRRNRDIATATNAAMWNENGHKSTAWIHAVGTEKGTLTRGALNFFKIIAIQSMSSTRS